MSFIAFSELHAYNNPSRSIFLEDGIRSWVKHQLNILTQIEDYAVESGIDTIIFGGDLFHEKNYISQDLYNIIWNKFKKLGEKFYVALNTGNHDYFSIDRNSTLKPFTSIVEVVKKPLDITFAPNTLIRIVPHGTLTEDILDTKQLKHKHLILFTHEDIQGLTYGANDYEFESRFKKSMFKNWTVFNGHIHKPQVLDNIINMGSCMQQNFGEEGEDKFFYIYDNGKYEKIKLEHPRFITVNSINDVDAKDNYNYYRINIYPEELKDPIFKKFNVEPNIVKKYKRECKIVTTQKETIKDIIEQYVALSETNLNKKKLIQLGLEITNNER